MSNINLGVSQSMGYENIQIVKTQKVANQNLTVYGTEENPMFLAKEVAEWIDYNKTKQGYYDVSAMLRTVDEDEKQKIRTTINNPSGSDMWFLTEDGVYEVLMQSRKPIAKTFKKEVKRILKDIRKHGMYARDELLDNPELLIDLATKLKQERDQRKQLEVVNTALTQQIGELKPKADYTDMVLQNKSLMSVTAIAKDYGMSGVALNKKLNELGIQYKQSGQWFLYAKHQTKGYTSSSTTTIEHKDGTTEVKLHTKWTQKGRLFIYNELKKIGIVPLIEQDLAS